MTMLRRGLGPFLWMCALPSVAWAQPELPADASQTVATLAHTIRWSGVAASIGVVIATSIVMRFLDKLANGTGDTFAEYRLTIQKVAAFTRFGLYFAAIMLVVLLSFRISTQVLAILGGTAAVAIGFAMKDLVSSVVGGVMIMFDRPFQVGDRVKFGGEYGDVLSIGLRSVKVRTLADSIVTIPNNLFFSEVTSCANYGVPQMQVELDFLIDVDSDVEQARSVVQEAAATSRYIHLQSPLVVQVNQVREGDYLAIRLRLKAYVLDTRHEKALETDVTLRVLEAFRAEAIHPPAVMYRFAEHPEGTVVRAPIPGDAA
jgi:small-conductance mechanosensitive channel